MILAIETKSLLIGEAASAEVERAIVAALEAGAEVERVIHLRTLHMGPESLLVAAKIAVRGSDRADVIAAGIDAAERRVRSAVPIAEMIYLEPDLYQRIPRGRDRPGGPRGPPAAVTAPTPVTAGRAAAGRLGSRPPAGSQAEQPQRPFLLELQRTGGQRLDPPDPAAELGDLRPDPGFGQDPQAERQRGRADVVALLDRQCQCHRAEVVLAELPVPGGGRPAAGRGAAGAGWLADGRQQAEQAPGSGASGVRCRAAARPP